MKRELAQKPSSEKHSADQETPQVLPAGNTSRALQRTLISNADSQVFNPGTHRAVSMGKFSKRQQGSVIHFLFPLAARDERLQRLAPEKNGTNGRKIENMETHFDSLDCLRAYNHYNHKALGTVSRDILLALI